MGKRGRHLIRLGLVLAAGAAPGFTAPAAYGWFHDIANDSSCFVTMQSTDPGGAGHDNRVTLAGVHHDKGNPSDILSQRTLAIFDCPYFIGPHKTLTCTNFVVPWKWYNGSLELTAYTPTNGKYLISLFQIYEDNNQIMLAVNNGTPKALAVRNGDTQYNVRIINDDSSVYNGLTVTVEQAH